MAEDNFAMGMLCCCVAAVGFGSNYLPVKKVDCGDGFFFAASMSLGIGLVGIIVHFSGATTGEVFHAPKFEPYAMVGGAAWMAGNLLTPTIIRLIGLGLGLSVWDLSNMMMGWATGNFGLFGVWREEAEIPWMNQLGFVLSCASLLLFAQAIEDPIPIEVCTNIEDTVSVKTGSTRGAASDVGSHRGRRGARAITVLSMGSTGRGLPVRREPQSDDDDDDEPATPAAPSCAARTAGNASSSGGERSSTEPDPEAQATGTPKSFRKTKLAAKTKPGCLSHAQRALGLVMALAAGTLFGYTFNPSTELMQIGREGGPHSTNPMDYVFSNFCGIMAAAAVALLGYVMVMGRRSYTPRCIVLPAIMSGIMWGVAQAAWFKANVALSIVVAFPIVSSLPGIVGLLWGVVFFGELRSTRSRCFAAAGILVRVPGVLLIGLSSRRG